MSIAEQIKQSDSDFLRVVENADTVAIDADQDWENQATTFVFSDGSKLKAQFPELTVF